jgi:hypothetical protein
MAHVAWRTPKSKKKAFAMLQRDAPMVNCHPWAWPS